MPEYNRETHAVSSQPFSAIRSYLSNPSRSTIGNDPSSDSFAIGANIRGRWRNPVRLSAQSKASPLTCDLL